jgi:hypothetical protein
MCGCGGAAEADGSQLVLATTPTPMALPHAINVLINLENILMRSTVFRFTLRYALGTAELRHAHM